MNYELRPYQDRAMRETLDFFKHRHKSALVVLPTGCHAKGESVLLANGQIKKVEDVKVGDELMGEDGSKRTVLCLHHGEDNLYKIVPKKGDPFVVNSKHMLTLQKTRERKIAKYPCEIYDDSYVDIPVDEYILLSKNKKHLLKLVHTKGVCFEKEKENDSKITIAPYFLGMLLGDGGLSTGNVSFTTMDKKLVDEVNLQAKKYGFDYRTTPSGKATTYYLKNSKDRDGASLLVKELKELGLWGHTSGEKFVPEFYKMTSKENRLELLAGLIDTDGHLTINSYDFTTKSKQLAEDIAFVCRSVGLRVYMTSCTKGIKKTNFVGTYYRLSISGDVSIIPCRVKIAEKRKQIKSWNRSGFEVEPVGRGEYFGFTVDKDNRYLLPDFTITHNCGKTSVMSAIAEVVSKNGGKVLFLAHRTTLVTQGAKAIEKATGIKVGKDRGKNEIPSESIIVSTVQAMSKDSRLEKYGSEFFNLIMIDESHHIPASSYQKVVSYFTKARILGVTATPKRGDHTDVTDMFESVSSEYTMYEAIQDGWLSPIKTQTCPVQIDVSKCEMQSGDYAVGDIGEALKPYMENIVDQIIEKSGNRKTIIFVPLVATAKSVVEMFRARGVDADYVAGERKDSDDVLKAYHNGEFRILVNSLLLCVDKETEILTDRGFVFAPEITYKDKIANWNFDGSVFFENPQKIITRPLDPSEHMVSVESKMNNFRVTNNHQMIVGCGLNKNKWKKINAENIDYTDVFPTCGISEPKEIEIETPPYYKDEKRALSSNAYYLRKREGYSFEESFVEAQRRINVHKSLKYKNPKDLTLDECKFIGFFIADGTTRSYKKDNAKSYIVCQSVVYPYIIKWFDNIVLNLGYDCVREERPANPQQKIPNGHIRWTFCRGTGYGSQERKGLFSIEPYLDKDGSHLLWGLNKEQFDALLEGYWMGDGEHRDGTNFSNKVYLKDTRKSWIELLCAIGSVRGWRCNMSTVHMKNPNHNTQYSLVMNNLTTKRCMSCKTNIIHEKYAPEMVYCVETTTKNIITRRKGRVMVMGNCEGYDEPSISCVVNLRLTKSEALYTQIIGRGTRLSPETGKEDLLVLDFLWKDKEKRKHLNAKSVVAAGDASISDEDLDDIQRACEYADEEPTDVFDGIERAKKDVRKQREEALARAIEETNRKQEEEEKKRKQREDQIRALGEAREEIVKGGKVVNVGDHLSIVYDEFGSMVLCAITNDEAVRQMGLSDYYPEGYSWEFAPPTENQMKTLMRLGFPVGYVASKGHCSFLMNALFDREKRGLCSYKQIKLLSRYKLGDLSMCSREKAKRGMDILSKNGWRPTSELYAVFNGKEFTASDATDTSNIEIC